MAVAKPGYDIDRSINIGRLERFLSVMSGLCLAYTGVRRYRMNGNNGMLMTLAGGALVARGLTGYCPAYDMMDRRAADDVLGDAGEPPYGGMADAVLAVPIERPHHTTPYHPPCVQHKADR